MQDYEENMKIMIFSHSALTDLCTLVSNLQSTVSIGGNKIHIVLNFYDFTVQNRAMIYK